MRPISWLAAALALGLARAASWGQNDAPCFDPNADVISGRTYQEVVAGLPRGESLPGRAFRVYIRAGMEEFRPRPINDTNRARRRIMVAMIQGVAGASAPLHPRLRDLIDCTSANHREHGAYIINDGTLGPVIVGEPGSVDDIGTIPPHAVGLVHTHPTPCAILAPPSAGDYGVLPFERYPVQLVIECDRVWGVLEPRHATLLGTLPPGGGFQPLPAGDPTAERAYAIVDGDALRLEAHDYEQCHARERQAAHERVLRELSERREAESAERRRQNSQQPDGGAPHSGSPP